MTNIDLSGRSVIMTGGAGGLGRAMAEGLLAAGAKVALADMDATRLARTAAELQRRFGDARAIGVVCDIRERDSCRRLVAAARDAFGGFQVLVNNAALGPVHLLNSPRTASLKFWEADPERWRDVVEVNVVGSFFMAAAATPHLLDQGWGRIVNVTTSLGTLQRKMNSPYGVTKSALEAATLIWAQELADTGVTVNSLLPGRAARTPFAANVTGDLLEPEIMVPPMLWLASTLSDGVTGGRFVGTLWDTALPPSDAAKAAREPPVLREPPPARKR